MTVAHVNKVKIFDYFILFDVSNILIMKINKQLVIINIMVKTEIALSQNGGANIPLAFEKHRNSDFFTKTQNGTGCCCCYFLERLRFYFVFVFILLRCLIQALQSHRILTFYKYIIHLFGLHTYTGIPESSLIF
jgi:hypothetical protein